MRALLLAALLSACSDSQSANDIAIDVAAETNAERGACTAGAWSITPPIDCAVVCANKPPQRTDRPANTKLFCCIQAPGVSCDADRWFEIDGVPGVCALVDNGSGPRRVDWQFCAENGWHLE